MKKIVFSGLEIRGEVLRGHLATNDQSEPPKVFFVFIYNYIVGELLFRDKWIFEQGNRTKVLKKLNTGECNYVARYLGNIAEEFYQ